MRVYFEFRDWMEERRDFAFAFIRIYLGIALIIRGVLFLSNDGVIQELVAAGTGNWAAPTLVAHYVALAHLVGGLFLALGFLTRIAAAAQVPVLFTAVFLVHFQDGLLTEGQALELSSLTLFLLVLFGLFGPGALSLDSKLFGDADDDTEAGVA